MVEIIGIFLGLCGVILLSLALYKFSTTEMEEYDYEERVLNLAILLDALIQ